MSTLTKAQLKTELSLNFGDNIIGDITPAVMRQMITDIIDSYPDVLETTVTVSSADILALNTTEKVLIAAAGVGTILIPHKVIFFLDYESTTYASGADVNIGFSGTTNYLMKITDTYWKSGADIYDVVSPAGAQVTGNANTALALRTIGSAFTTGNSPVKLKIFYSIVTLP